MFYENEAGARFGESDTSDEFFDSEGNAADSTWTAKAG